MKFAVGFTSTILAVCAFVSAAPVGQPSGTNGASSASDISAISHFSLEDDTSSDVIVAEHLGAGSVAPEPDVSRREAQLQQAQAVSSWTPNPGDPSEVPLTKGEIVDVLDDAGSWWTVRKADGQTGIVPRGFLKLI